ncbi:MAG: hypothetical protein JWO78_82 [Micavibrio sp.]|nr:hypothetical protein [Micavibrio sp.]
MAHFKFAFMTLSASALILLAPAAASAATLYNSTTATTTTTVPAAAPTPAVTTNAAPATITTPITGVSPAAPATTTAAATTTPAITGAPPSAQAAEFGKQAGAVCPGKWDSAECLSVLSTSNLAMASNFGAALKNKGLETDAEQVKQHCAASTAAQKQAYPGYAMKSAFIECANLIADITQKTGVQPDLSQYQLMVGATMCLDNDIRCAGIAEQLKTLATR